MRKLVLLVLALCLCASGVLADPFGPPAITTRNDVNYTFLGPVIKVNEVSVSCSMKDGQWTPDGQPEEVRSWEFAPDGRLLKSTEQYGNRNTITARYAYDNAGRLVSTETDRPVDRFGFGRDPSKRVYIYDQAGRLTKIIQVYRDSDRPEHTISPDGKRNYGSRSANIS